MQRKSNAGRSVPIKMIQIFPHRMIAVAVGYYPQGSEDFLLGRDAVMILKKQLDEGEIVVSEAAARPMPRHITDNDHAAGEQVFADNTHQHGIVFQNQDAILDGTSDAAILAVCKTCTENSSLLRKQCLIFRAFSSACACDCCKVTLQGYEHPLFLDEEISLYYNW